MATKFKKGEAVRINTPVPQGPVMQFRMDDDGNVEYLVQWTDAEGQIQQRWFAEAQLEGV